MNSSALRHATRVGAVAGPLCGYHREWYVVEPPDELATGRVKVGEPREGVLWFDRRCFASEDELLIELARRHFPRIPPVHRIGAGGPTVHGFIEGRTLAELRPAPARVGQHHLDQLMELFRSLAGVRPKEFPVPRLCLPQDRQDDGESAGFFRRLIHFTYERAYLDRISDYGALFQDLGITEKWASALFDPLRERAGAVRRRPFCLLHGDLHRANFVIDADGDLWTIDWELAMLGDPLYDLATHLYLTAYPPAQAKEVKERWRSTMADALPGAAEAVDEDLPHYLAYKHAQSVFTDVVRQAEAVRAAEPEGRAEQLRRTAKTVEHVLRRAKGRPGLLPAPDPGAIELAYDRFCRT